MLSLLSLYFLLGSALVIVIKEHLASDADERLAIDLRININEALPSIFCLCEVSDACIIVLCITLLISSASLSPPASFISRFVNVHCVHVSLAPACIRNAKGKLHYQMTFRTHLAHEKQISSSNVLEFISLVGH